MNNDDIRNDGIQHGIDNDPNHDTKKGAQLGGIGGAVTGAVAGSMVGPGGAIVGAIIGAAAGALGSGAAVHQVDKYDNDNTISGIGSDSNYSANEDEYRTDYNTRYASTGNSYDNYSHAYQYGDNLASHPRYADRNWDDFEPEARADWEAANPGTWDSYRDATRTGWERSRGTTAGSTGYAYADAPTGTPNGVPGIQTGGHAADGSPDTRGITEKIADKMTGDNIDDKTGKRTV